MREKKKLLIEVYIDWLLGQYEKEKKNGHQEMF